MRDCNSGDGTDEAAERLITKRQSRLTMSREALKAVKLVALEDDISTSDVKSASRGGNYMLRIAQSEFAFCLSGAVVTFYCRVAQAALLMERIARA